MVKKKISVTPNRRSAEPPVLEHHWAYVENQSPAEDDIDDLFEEPSEPHGDSHAGRGKKTVRRDSERIARTDGNVTKKAANVAKSTDKASSEVSSRRKETVSVPRGYLAGLAEEVDDDEIFTASELTPQPHGTKRSVARISTQKSAEYQSESRTNRSTPTKKTVPSTQLSADESGNSRCEADSRGDDLSRREGMPRRVNTQRPGNTQRGGETSHRENARRRDETREDAPRREHTASARNSKSAPKVAEPTIGRGMANADSGLRRVEIASLVDTTMQLGLSASELQQCSIAEITRRVDAAGLSLPPELGPFGVAAMVFVAQLLEQGKTPTATAVPPTISSDSSKNRSRDHRPFSKREHLDSAAEVDVAGVVHVDGASTRKVVSRNSMIASDTHFHSDSVSDGATRDFGEVEDVSHDWREVSDDSESEIDDEWDREDADGGREVRGSARSRSGVEDQATHGRSKSARWGTSSKSLDISATGSSVAEPPVALPPPTRSTKSSRSSGGTSVKPVVKAANRPEPEWSEEELSDLRDDNVRQASEHETPLESFGEMHFSEPMMRALAAAGYSQPTPIQAGLIPLALEGEDLMGQAQTGTGKTAAFAIPILEKTELRRTDRQPVALVLCPTRELAVQTRDEFVKLSGPRSVRVVALYGGKPIKKQADQLHDGADVIVGTPGRILDHLNRRTLTFASVRIVVLDEADRMLDIGFRPDIEKILRRCPESRQTLLLSATLPSPVKRLAERYMRDPEVVDFSPKDIAAQTIEQFYFPVFQEEKYPLLVSLLQREQPTQAIVFCRTRRGTEKIGHALQKIFDHCEPIHGDLAQSQRDRVMRAFRAGEVQILVATDVVGRGIDVSGISHIINYDIPQFCDDYVHRVGRAGRMGREGIAFTLVTPEEGIELTRIEMRINKLLAKRDPADYITRKPHQERGDWVRSSGNASENGVNTATDPEAAVEPSKPKAVFGRPKRRVKRTL